MVRRRVRSLEGEPYYLNDSYYPYELVSGTELMSPADIPQGATPSIRLRNIAQRKEDGRWPGSLTGSSGLADSDS